MELPVSVLAIDFGFKLAVCLVLFFNYSQNRASSEFFLSLGWLFYTLNSCYGLLFFTSSSNLPAYIITTVFFVKYFSWTAMGLTFLKAILSLKKIEDDFKIILLMLLVVLSSFAGAFIAGEKFWAVLPCLAIGGFSLMICAVYFRQLKLQVSAFGNQFVFYGFLLNGLRSFNQLFLETGGQFAFLDFFLSLVVTVIFAAGLIEISRYEIKTFVSSGTKDDKELSALYKIASMNFCDTEVQNIFSEILEKTAGALKLEAGVLYLLDEEKRFLSPKASLNIPIILREKMLQPIEIGQGLIGEAVAAGGVKIIGDIFKSPISWSYMKKTSPKTFIALPLKNKNYIFGALVFVTCLPQIFARDEIGLFESAAEKISAVVENARKCISVKKTARELGTLYNVNLSIKHYLNMENLLDEILRKVVSSLDTEAGAIYIVNHKEDNFVLRAKIGLSDGFTEDVRSLSLDSGTLTAQVARTRKAVCVEDISVYPTPIQKAVQEEKLCGYCGVPIISAAGKIIGVLIVTTKEVRKFKEEEVQLLISIAHGIATAVENAKLYEDLQDVYLRSVTVLAEVVGAKDHYTYSHSKYVTAFAVKIANEMNLPNKEVEIIRKACQLHDIGKISISDYILTKKRKLNQKEWDEVKKHPQRGAAILEPLTFLKEPKGGVIELIKQHHEKYDGKGYPQGLKGEGIELGARIMAVADAYHAMISNRPYRRSLSQKKAVQELKKCSNTQFDPGVVEAFLKILTKEKKYAGAKT